MNEYDSNRMKDLLVESHGFSVVNNPEEADLILLNTCSIREKAQEKVFHQLGRWKDLKKRNVFFNKQKRMVAARFYKTRKIKGAQVLGNDPDETWFCVRARNFSKK